MSCKPIASLPSVVLSSLAISRQFTWSFLCFHGASEGAKQLELSPREASSRPILSTRQNNSIFNSIPRVMAEILEEARGVRCIYQ